MRYFFVQNKNSGNVREIHSRQFADLESAQKSAIANVRDLISDALLLGKSPEHISIEIWEESGAVVSVIQGSEPEDELPC